MSAGLADFLGPTEVWTKISEYHTPEQLLPYFEDLPLMFEPGTDWAYCNSCYVVLGLIIERVSGMTYRDFLQVNILEPQNMTSTGYDPYDQEFASQKAVGYDSVLSLPPSQSILLSASIAFAAGGIFSTVKDLYKWDRQLYKDNLISKKSLEKIFTPGLGNYGFGWYIENLNVCGVERKFAWHWGSYLGYHSFIARFPEDDVFIVILENYTSPDLRNSAVLLPTVQAAAEIAFKYNHNK